MTLNLSWEQVISSMLIQFLSKSHSRFICLSSKKKLRHFWSNFRPDSELVKAHLFKRCPGRGGANLGSFLFLFIFYCNCSTLDHSATAPPFLRQTFHKYNRCGLTNKIANERVDRLCWGFVYEDSTLRKKRHWDWNPRLSAWVVLTLPVFFVPPSTTIFAHFKKKGCNLWLP